MAASVLGSDYFNFPMIMMPEKEQLARTRRSFGRPAFSISCHHETSLLILLYDWCFVSSTSTSTLSRQPSYRARLRLRRGVHHCSPGLHPAPSQSSTNRYCSLNLLETDHSTLKCLPSRYHRRAARNNPSVIAPGSISRILLPPYLPQHTTIHAFQRQFLTIHPW